MIPRMKPGSAAINERRDGTCFFLLCCVEIFLELFSQLSMGITWQQNRSAVKVSLDMVQPVKVHPPSPLVLSVRHRDSVPGFCMESLMSPACFPTTAMIFSGLTLQRIYNILSMGTPVQYMENLGQGGIHPLSRDRCQNNAARFTHSPRISSTALQSRLERIILIPSSIGISVKKICSSRKRAMSPKYMRFVGIHCLQIRLLWSCKVLITHSFVRNPYA